MTMQIPFVPHPRLDYTEKYNAHLDYIHRRDLELQRQDAEQSTQRLENFQEKVRLERNLQRVNEMKELALYNFLDRNKAYHDYKYAYWVGTLVDQYI